MCTIFDLLLIQVYWLLYSWPWHICTVIIIHCWTSHNLSLICSDDLPVNSILQAVWAHCPPLVLPSIDNNFMVVQCAPECSCTNVDVEQINTIRLHIIKADVFENWPRSAQTFPDTILLLNLVVISVFKVYILLRKVNSLLCLWQIGNMLRLL